MILITGGQRSGKSRFGQKLAEERSANPVYLATARSWDEDFQTRIERHRQDRGDFWETLEEELRPGKHDLSGRTVLLDCVTLWLTNIFHDCGYETEKSLNFAQKEWNALMDREVDLIVITNELGMGVHADTESARKFTDLQGWMNQFIANRAETVYLMVAGIPTRIKPNE